MDLLRSHRTSLLVAAILTQMFSVSFSETSRFRSRTQLGQQPINPLVGCELCHPLNTNATCRRVSGLFTRPNLPLGYNAIARLPQGACFVSVTELGISKNYLALREENGNYVINGKWNIDRSGTYGTVGTIFTYKRHDVRRARGESLFAPGPLQEALYLLLIYQQPNTGIKYEYMLPSSSTDLLVPLSHPYIVPLPLASDLEANEFPDNGPLQEQPHHQLRHQRPGHRRTGKRLGPQSNDAVEESDLGQDVLSQEIPNKKLESKKKGKDRGKNKQRKTYRWKLEENVWSDCSATCGLGTKTQTSICVRISHNPDGKPFSPVDDRHCKGVSKPLALQTQCDSNVTCPEDNLVSQSPTAWKSGEWGHCSVSCGAGTRSRLVSCVSDDISCQEEDKPKETQNCHLAPCTSTWLVSNWDSQCSSCRPDTVRKRRVLCSDQLGPDKSLEEVNCDRRKRPVPEQNCHVVLKDKGVDCESVGQWMTTSWSKCSVSCGFNGWETRSVMCIVDKQVVDKSNCSTNEEPASRKVCNPGLCPAVDLEPNEGVWYTSEWAECSNNCDGTQDRDIVCLNTEGHVDQICAIGSKPVSKRQCSKPDKECDNVCEDKDTFCNLVARARLCRYEHYRTRCCNSCQKLKVN